MAFANASIVTTATPDRYFAWSQMGLGVLGLALFAAVPSMLTRLGPDSVFIMIGAAALATSPLAISLPAGARRSAANAAPSPTVPPPLVESRTLWRALAGLATIFVGCQGAWAFLERAGVAQGFSTAEVAHYLVLGQVVGLSGPLASRAVGRRYSWHSGVTLGLIISGLAVLAVTQATSSSLFIYGAAGFNFGTLCVVTSYLSYLAVDDASGRSAAAAPSAINLGCAIGPAAMGLLWNTLGPGITGWSVVASYVLGASLLLFQQPHPALRLSR
jgi:predicted MFS family arabinose efflux permease